MRHIRRLLILISVTFWVLNRTVPSEEESLEYPTRPIKLIVPFGAGGGTDNFARLVKQTIEEEELLPQPIVVINRGGAGATIGSRSVKNAKADGYTMLVLHEAMLTAKWSQQVSYGPEAFAPVAGTGEVGMVLTVNENSPYQTLNDLLDAARETPNEITFGANLGAITHFVGLWLEKEGNGAKFRFVQSGGGADRQHDLIGGHTDVTGFSTEEFLRFQKTGLRGLAYFGAKSKDDVRNGDEVLKTASDQDVEIVMTNLFCWWMPKSTPQEHIDVVAEALEKAMQSPALQQKLKTMHVTPVFLKGDPLKERIQESTAKITAVEPPGETRVPNFLAWLSVICVSLAVLSVLQKRDRLASNGGVSPKANVRIDRVASVLGLACLYVFLMARGWVSYTWATFGFVLLVGVTLSKPTRLSFGGLLENAVLLSFGLHVLFTQVFVVDLP